ncbi:MAG TPA: hypothetical protein DDW23_00095 [Planctomycetes bacterium]|nr:hypothetical protein [Planctomycetota bacterium]
MISIPAVALIATLAVPQSGPKDQVRVWLDTPRDLDLLLSIATDPDDHGSFGADQSVRIYADDAEQDLLRQRGFKVEVEIEDLSSFYASRAAADSASSARSGGGSMGGFKTLAEIEQKMDSLAVIWPQLVSQKFSVGTSHEGRDIWAMRISDTPGAHDPSEPTAWFDALHHAREPMSGESLLMYAEWLCANYGIDSAATRLVETRNILFIPCVNPDGYEYNRQTNPNGGGMWRKNRRVNGGGSYGVDLNRNYDYEWGAQWNGSSGNPSSETYRGPAAFSEPETAALGDLLDIWTPGFAFSVHTYSNLLLFPWGYDTVFTAEDALYRKISAKMTANNGYAYGTVWEVLYTANGGAGDYHHAVCGSFGLCFEIGSANDGFWPAPSRIPALFADVLPGYQMATQWSGASADLKEEEWTEIQGDGDESQEPGESWLLGFQVANNGMEDLAGLWTAVSGHGEIAVSGGPQPMNATAFSEGIAQGVQLDFAPTAIPGQAYELDLVLNYDGASSTETFSVTLGKPRILLHDDMEIDNFGWKVLDATNYSWERAIPQATSSSGQVVQPGNDNPSGSGSQCWVTGAAAGSSAGTNDVDGRTTLVSPRFSLNEFSSAELEYARWFANLPGNAQDDTLLVEISPDNGTTWTTLEDRANDNQWRTVSFAVENFVPLTGAMRLRLTVADEPNNDLTEACLDNLVLRTYSALPTLGIWGEASLGSKVLFCLDGPEQAAWTLIWSFSRVPGVPVPGIEGELQLNNPRILLSGQLAADGRAEIQAAIPNNPSLSGRTVHLQSVFAYGTPEAIFSNAVSVPIL